MNFYKKDKKNSKMLFSFKNVIFNIKIFNTHFVVSLPIERQKMETIIKLYTFVQIDNNIKIRI